MSRGCYSGDRRIATDTWGIPENAPEIGAFTIDSTGPHAAVELPCGRCDRRTGFVAAAARSAEFKAARLRIRRQDITEVDSHDHALLQCLDVVLGAICFRLNDKHLMKPPGSRVRGSRTIAKEKLYRHIHQRICALRPNFNIGITTGGGAGESLGLAVLPLAVRAPRTQV